MISCAFISGEIGKALFKADGACYSLSPESKPVEISAWEFESVLSNSRWDFELIRQTTLDYVQEKLALRARQHNCLFLLLALLDNDVSLSTRVTAAQASDQLLKEQDVTEFVWRRLLSFPLPVSARSGRHQQINAVATFPEIRGLLHELFESQPILDEIWGEWEQSVTAIDAGPTLKKELESYFVSNGLFADLRGAIKNKDIQRFNSRLVYEATKPDAPTDISARTLLMDFRIRLHKKFFLSEQQPQARLKLRHPGKSAVAPKQTEGADFISALIDRSEEEGRNTAPGLSRREAKSRVDRQLEAIKLLIYGGKNTLAEKYLEELLQFQLGQGDREHAAMSLCSLAAIALDANQLAMADRLSEYAIKLNVYDPVVYTLRAEVFKNRAHFNAALQAYEEVKERFPDTHYAHNGYADVLSEMGRFQESLNYYREAQKRFPDNPVAFNGEVSTLRKAGQLRAAVKTAVRNVKKFPYDAVSRGVFAGCLSTIGKYDEALRHYRAAFSLDASNTRVAIGYSYALKAAGNIDEAFAFIEKLIQRAPNIASYGNARARLLQSIGRFPEALKQYEAVLNLFPAYSPARFGIASLKILSGQYESASLDVPTSGMESEIDWFGYRTYALSFVSSRAYDAAVEKLRFGAESCPWISEQRKFETALGYAELARSNWGAAISTLQRRFDILDQRQQQSRLLMLAHSQAERGEKNLSKVLLTSLFASKDPQLVSIQRQLLDGYHLMSGDGGEHPLLVREQLVNAELSLALAA